MTGGSQGRHAIENWWSDERVAPAPVRALLGCASLLYRCGRTIHRGLYASGLRRRRRLPVPVVSVGNVTVGGSGKTPFVAWLARELAQRGSRLLVVGRGYGRPAGSRLNEEGEWLERVLPAVRVVQAADRFRAARTALAQAPADLVLLDDGFQHEALARDLDVVLVDARVPFGNGRLLPGGPLREPLSALARARFVFATRAELAAPGRLAALRERIAASAPRARVGTVRFEIGALRRGDAREPPALLNGRDVVLLTGVGSPASVRATVERLGARVAQELAFPDHHPFERAELDAARARADARGAELVVTAKDAVKLDRLGGSGRYLVLEQEVAVDEAGAGLVDAIGRLVGASPVSSASSA